MDYTMFRTINQSAGRNPLLDMLMIFVSNKVRYLFLVVFLSLFFKNKSYREVARSAIASAGMTLLINNAIQRMYYKPRPFMIYKVNMLTPSKTNSSFLSKHTLLSFAIATSIYLRERILGAILLGVSVLTGFSRIWVGVHYPSDIIRSAFISMFTSVGIDQVLNHSTLKNR